MTVTMGARGCRSSSLSSSSTTASLTSALTYSVVNPYSSAMRLMVSASMRWLMLTMMPMLMHVPIICVTGTFIIVASSLAVTNSVSFSTLLSAACCSSSSSMPWRMASRFSRRYLAPLPSLLSFEVRRASVSRTCLATSSSLTSCGSTVCLGWFFFFFFPWPCCCCCWFCCLLRFWLPWFCCWLATALMSTRCCPMRARFFLSPCFSSRSLRFSSLVFFLGRVL